MDNAKYILVDFALNNHVLFLNILFKLVSVNISDPENFQLFQKQFWEIHNIDSSLFY